MNKYLHIKEILDNALQIYHNQNFIEDDPICIPHKFSLKQDIEIAAFFSAIFAWGARKIIISKSNLLMELMHNEPYSFILHHTHKDLLSLKQFKHRIFTYDDLKYFLFFLQKHYQQYSSLESAFSIGNTSNMFEILKSFRKYFLSFPHLQRTEKHIANVEKNASCKRLNMFLRWMVRKDKFGIDFGIWDKIKTSDLICPMDVHVSRVAYALGIIDTDKSDWKNAVALTNFLKKINPHDPVLYDYALFSMGVYTVK